MSDYTMQLAALGARVMGLWGFDGITDPDDLVTQVGEAIYKVGLDYGNTQQVREICYTHQLDTVAYGDHAPTLGGDYPQHQLLSLQLAHDAWEDARASDSNDAETDAAAALINALLNHSRITVTFADGSTR